MYLNIDEVKSMLEGKGWSEVMFARKIGLDYSYVYRVLRGDRGIGAKFLAQLIKLCEKENLFATSSDFSSQGAHPDIC